MTIDQELRLSYYRQVADIHAEHGVSLVQDVRTGKFYVKKLLTVYNADIYRCLQSNPVANTPRVYLVEEDNGVLTVIEEFIPGDTLEEYLEQRGVLSEEEAMDIALQLCRILSDFHRCTPAIVNRDIKPSNIMLTPEGVVKLLDMNAAKWSDSGSDRDTVLLGTRGYAAPEQYGFGPSSVLTDIYAVGVLINVMLTGELPNRRIADGKPGKIIGRCVELSPAHRYQSVAELLAELEHLSGQVPRNRTPHWQRYLPPGYRSRNVIKWLFATLGYALCVYIGCGLELEGAGRVELILNRIAAMISVFSIILFNGNYLGVNGLFVLTRSKYRLVRWLGMAVVDFAILSLWVILLNLLVAVLGL